MAIFCKLFGRGGDQALVMKDLDERGNPAISVCFDVGAGSTTLTLTYKNEEFRDRAFKAATKKTTWALMDEHCGTHNEEETTQ